MAGSVEGGVLVWLVEEDVRCPICYDPLRSPATLPCGHSFCSACLCLYWERCAHLGLKGPEAPCSLCRWASSSRKLPGPSVILQALVDKYLAALQESGLGSPGPHPDKDPQVLRKGAVFRREVEDLVEQLESEIALLRSLEPHQKCELADDRNYLGKDSSCGMESVKAVPEPGSPNPFEKNISGIERTLDKLKKKLQETLIWAEAPEETLQDEPVAAVASPSILLPATRPSSCQRSSQFSQWAVHLTFDLRSISHYLEVSECGRRVIVSSHKQAYTDCPERFRINQVLCSEGFSSGHRYWEVRTEQGTTWSAGVAMKEPSYLNHYLGRKGLSWCIEWAGRQLAAWHQGEKIPIGKDKPRVLGVFLDLEAGELSFYSVDSQERLLHQFKVDVSAPLFPAFWLYGAESGNSLVIS
ncbi:E3 ubiquitin-protein ligase RNF135 [Ornithorhynchus anatinus]|uniref:Ring finger protein 135 n=1 Tax=Ornithorhynchus anatinus TaxID=9258 RepID=F7ENL3_ORNAN|nr:E3 ubiquitin-protein ligase RNF135 [Ornithorhynchus anatinus]